jgi:GT2 family glycosyltransferase
MLTSYSKKKKNFIFINAQANLGFGKANNLGAISAKGQYLVFQNSDTLYTYDLLEAIQNKIKSYHQLGVYSCRLLNADGSFQPSGGSFPNLLNIFFWQMGIDDLPFVDAFIKSFHPKQSGLSYKMGPDWITGAFMVFPASVFSESGGFDESIFMYTEEMELLYRTAQMKKNTVYDDSESLIHLGGASGGSFLAITSEVKYMIYFYKKHKPAWQTPVVKMLFFTGSLLRLLFFGIIKNDGKYKKAYLEALRLSV